MWFLISEMENQQWTDGYIMNIAPASSFPSCASRLERTWTDTWNSAADWIGRKTAPQS